MGRPKKSKVPVEDVAKKSPHQQQEKYEERLELASQEPKNYMAMIRTDDEIAESVARVLAQPSHSFRNDVTDDEIEARVEEFFRWCAETGTRPSVERFALAIGTTRDTIRRWRNGIGCSDDRKYMMQQAVEAMAAFDAEMVNTGKMPVVSYIWRSKNLYDFVDQQRIIIESNVDRVQSAESLVAEARNLAGDFVDVEYKEVRE